MYYRKDQNFSKELSAYTKFTAMYDPEFNWTILFKRNQATRLGIELDKFQKSYHTGKYENHKILNAPIIVNAIIPIMKNSELRVYKFPHSIQTAQMINIDEEDSDNQDRVIIGRRFLEFLHLTTNDSMKEMMGACGERTFSRITGEADFEFWEGNIEALGLYQALKFSGRDLMVGNVDLPELGEEKLSKEKRDKGTLICECEYKIVLENLGVFDGVDERKTGEDMSCKISTTKETKCFGLSSGLQLNQKDFTILSQDLSKMLNAQFSEAQNKG